MRGLVKTFDQRRQAGVILFGVDLEFPFILSDVEGPVILRRGDEVSFNVRDRGPGQEAFDVRLDRGCCDRD